jgi:LTXXQ motif family protein
MPMAANKSLNARNQAGRPQVAGSACVAAMLLLLVPLLTLEADARGGGGGFGGRGGGFGGHGGGFGGGFGGHVGFAGRGGGIGFAGRGAGFGGARSFGVTRIGGTSFGNRSLGVARIGGTHFVGRPIAGRSLAGRSLSGARVGMAPARFGSGTRFATASVAGPGLRGAHLGRSVFGNRAIANAAWRSRFASSRFHGRFFGSRSWPWWRGGLVVGWVGPLFWPYVDYDFFDYVFWPYAYDDFWPYAYDDVYYGIYGNYGYIPPAVSSAPRAGSSAAHRTARKDDRQRRAADVCSDDAAQLADWPIERISEVVQPTDAQHPALEELRAASAKAIDMLKAGCPKDLPSIPTGRLAAMESRLQVMLAAVQTVRPSLERFYQSLGDEQKARFNAIAPGDEPDAAAKDRRDLTKFCDEKTPGVTDLPIARIAQAVQPTPTQRAALDELQNASVKAAERLKANCPDYQTLTPTGRVEAMEKRLEATLGAVRTVQPALAKFYDSLSDEQKARFNSLRSVSRPIG